MAYSWHWITLRNCKIETARSRSVLAKRKARPILLSIGICLSLQSSGYSQTTQLLGDGFAYRSTGDSLKASTWTLDRDGYLGTYITLAAPGNVTVNVQAEGTAS